MAPTEQARRGASYSLKVQVADYSKRIEKLSTLDQRVADAAMAGALRYAKIRIPKGHFDFPTADRIDIVRTERKARDRRKQLDSKLTPFEQLAGQRLHRTLQWLRVSKLVARLDNGPQLAKDSQKLLPILTALAGRVSGFHELRFASGALNVLCAQLSPTQNDPELIEAIKDQMKQVRQQLAALTDGFGNLDYPFDHAKGRISVAKYLGIYLSQDDLGELLSTAEQAIERFGQLYTAVAARLTQIAEQIEDAAARIIHERSAAEPAE